MKASDSAWLDAVWTMVRDWVPESHRAARLEELMWLWQCEGCRDLETLVCEDFPEAEEAYRLLLDYNKNHERLHRMGEG